MRLPMPDIDTAAAADMAARLKTPGQVARSFAHNARSKSALLALDTTLL